MHVHCKRSRKLHTVTSSQPFTIRASETNANVASLRSLDSFEIRARQYNGQISSVYRAVDRQSGITVALKLYKRAMLNDMERHQIAREIWLHIQLAHPSIIALYAAWKDADYIYLVLEWAPEVMRCYLRCASRCCAATAPLQNVRPSLWSVSCAGQRFHLYAEQGRAAARERGCADGAGTHHERPELHSQPGMLGLGLVVTRGASLC